jgi:hypothetical protein
MLVVGVHTGRSLDVLLVRGDAGLVVRNVEQVVRGRRAVKLKFLGKDSTPTNSPTLYATDQGSYLVQGCCAMRRLVVSPV